MCNNSTLLGRHQVALDLQAVAPTVHVVKGGGGKEVDIVLHVRDLEGELVGAVVSQGELEVGPQLDAAFAGLLLPPLVQVFVVVKGRLLGVLILFQDKEVRLPVF